MSVLIQLLRDVTSELVVYTAIEETKKRLSWWGAPRAGGRESRNWPASRLHLALFLGYWSTAGIPDTQAQQFLSRSAELTLLQRLSRLLTVPPHRPRSTSVNEQELA